MTLDSKAFYDAYWADRKTRGALYAEGDAPYRLILASQVLEAFQVQCALDIGCGDGSLGRTLKTWQGGTRRLCLVGTDISSTGMDLAAEDYDEVVPWDLDSEGVPQALRDRTFDAVVCTEVLEHLIHPHGALQKMAQLRMEKPVLFIFSFPNYTWWPNRASMVLGRPPQDCWQHEQEHLHRFSLETFTDLLRSEGFLIETVKGAPTALPGISRIPGLRRWLPRLGAKAWPSLLSSQIGIVATRPRET